MEKTILNKTIYQILSDILMRDLNESENGLDTKLDELGVNSFNYVKLAVEIEDAFGLDLSLRDMDMGNNTFTSIGSITDFVQAKLNEQAVQ